MNCGLCDSSISLCGSCRATSCPTPVCSRCALAQPEAHSAAATGPTITLGEPELISMDW